MDFAACLKAQYLAHPSLGPQDAVKMCYQVAYGAEHAITDIEAVMAYLRHETDRLEPDGDEALYEPIDDSLCRVNLRPWKAKGLPLEWLAAMFLRAKGRGSDYYFDCIDTVTDLSAYGELGFDIRDWGDYLRPYFNTGKGPVHHSEPYREAEKPAYRLALLADAETLPILELMAQKGCGVLAIDGRAASGKTGLADRLAAVTGAPVAEMDNFFLPLEKRTPERLAESGGNVDYERFGEEVLPSLRSGKAFSYGVFDCSVMEINRQKHIPAAPWRIVEGSYSCHPVLGDYADIRVFSTVEPEEQLQRIIKRNGEAMAKRFENEWIPMEERYFKEFCIREKADLIVGE